MVVTNTFAPAASGVEPASGSGSIPTTGAGIARTLLGLAAAALAAGGLLVGGAVLGRRHRQSLAPRR